MAEEKETPLQYGRKVLGSILKDLRKEAGLPTKFAADGPLKMRDTMIRMIENGHADLPINKVYGYAEALNDKARGAWTIDPTALALAYASLRSLAAGQAIGNRFDWTALRKSKKVASKYVREQLTRSEVAVEDPRGDKSYRPEFEYLNPIQRQMVIDIARRIAIFGSDIVTDEALAEWEKANAGQITRVLVATTSLGSELQEEFIKSITAISQPPEFSEWRYLLATADQQSFDNAQQAFERAIQDSSVQSKDKSNVRKVRSKFKIKRITLDQFRNLENDMRQDRDQDRGWDGLYLYNVKYGQDLLIGAFRRCPSLQGISRPGPDPIRKGVREQIPALTPERWGCVPVNEALRWSSNIQFTEAHDTLWELVN